MFSSFKLRTNQELPRNSCGHTARPKPR